MFLHSWNCETNYTNRKNIRPAGTLEDWPLSILLKLRSPACLRKAKDFTPNYNLKKKFDKETSGLLCSLFLTQVGQLPQSVK